MSRKNGLTILDAYIKASNLLQKAACCVNKQGKFLHANATLSELLEYENEETSSLKIFDIDPSMSRFSWQAYWQQLQNNGTAIYTSTELITKSEHLIPVHVVGILVETKDTSFCYIAFNTTKLATLPSVSEEMMKYTVDNAREMIFWIDLSGNIVYVNNKVAKVSGIPQNTIQTMKVWNFSNYVKRRSDWDKFFQAVKTHKHIRFPLQSMNKAGENEYLEAFSTYIIYSGEEYIFILVVDITERETQAREIARLNKELRNERNYLSQEIISVHNFNEIITQNEHYQRIIQEVQKVAPTDATVLILGETGTGKELIARAIHDISTRNDRAMIKVNCATLPANLIESELFGHEKGAFTGAHKQKVGRFELANKGTIFLDEIGEMPLDLQAKLLRALQEGEIERLGGTKIIKIDVRVIAATNRDLEAMVEKGNFREDLYYRLNVFPIHNLPLRERKDDIPLLTNFFVDKFCKKLGRSRPKINQAVMNRLMRYDYPGNIRELENIIERALILSQGDRLNIDVALPSIKSEQRNTTKSVFPSLDEVQRNHILEALKKTRWKITGKNSASELLQMNGKTLASRMKKLNISRHPQDEDLIK